MTTTYDERADADVHRQESEAAWLRARFVPVGFNCGTAYSDAEAHAIILHHGYELRGVSARWLRPNMSPQENEAWSRRATAECERVVEQLVRVGVLDRGADGLLRRAVPTTKQAVYVSDSEGANKRLVLVPPNEAAALIDSEKAKLAALTPEAKAARRLDDLEAEIERLRAAQS